MRLALVLALATLAGCYTGNPPWPVDPTQPALRAAGGRAGTPIPPVPGGRPNGR